MKTTLVFCFYSSWYYGIDSFKYSGPPTAISPPTISSSLIMPERAMKTNAIQEFHINKDINTQCQLSPAKYFVKKQIDEEDENEFVFYVARYDAVIETRFSTTSPDFPTTGEGNIGVAQCTPGMIDLVDVEGLARRCGIAKVLSALCMLDPKIHLMEEGNNALWRLDQHSDNEHIVFLRKCVRLVALVNEAVPYAGAFAYLKAAQHSGLQYLVVHRRSIQSEKPKRKKGCYGEFLAPYEVNHILTTNLFKGDTGQIEDIAGSGRGATWYFCKR